MFLRNKNIIFKIRRSKVTDYAALSIFKFKPMFKQHVNLVFDNGFKQLYARIVVCADAAIF